MSSSRQLAAIMFTDIVGYTALMGKDSAKALELIRISKEIQKPLVEKHNGKWLKEMGDGAMAQFSTALDSVNCAIEIQKQARVEFDGKLRIGIHSGDITIEDDDVFGDGVNVAFRLESIADPEGIYISESIEKAIRGQTTDVQAKYLGEIHLKNVDYGVRTYAIQGEGLPLPDVRDQKKLTGNFRAELQRRGIIRAGISYLVVALLLILLLNQVQYWGLELPEWSSPLLFIVLGVGFIVAQYLAWNYERSPDGLVRTTSQQSWRNPYSASQRKPFTSNSILVGLILAIIIVYIYPRILTNPAEDNAAEARVTIDDRSIAIIPFANMSNDPDQEYFSDGMMEEILNHLAQIQDLKVTSRTTTMNLKGSDKSIQEIGIELGVAHVLEGSVRKQGNKVRITIQLIDVSLDQHLWSASYDRDMDDVFAIQSEVAQQVAATLQAQINPEVRRRIEAQPTFSMEAYDSYLEAIFHWRLATDESWQRALNLLERAIQIDPEFADPYVWVGFMRSSFSWGGQSMVSSPEEAVNIAEPYYERALELDPDNLNAHLFMGFLRLWYEWDFQAAEKEYELTSQLNMNFSWGDLHIALGRFEEAMKRAESAVDVDPLDPVFWPDKILSLYFANQPQRALESIETAMNGGVFDSNVQMTAGRVYLYLKKYDIAIETVEKLIQDYDLRNPRPLGTLAIAYHHSGEFDKANDLLSEIKQQNVESSTGSPSFYIAMIYAQMGEVDLAFELLDKAYLDHEVEMYWLKVEPPFEPLHDDPRWQEMLDKVGFPD